MSGRYIPKRLVKESAIIGGQPCGQVVNPGEKPVYVVVAPRHAGTTFIATIDPRASCLLLVPEAVFEDIEEKLIRLPTNTPQSRRFVRFVLGFATTLDVDADGGVTIPPELIAAGNIDVERPLIETDRYYVWPAKQDRSATPA